MGKEEGDGASTLVTRSLLNPCLSGHCAERRHSGLVFEKTFDAESVNPPMPTETAVGKVMGDGQQSVVPV